MPDGDCGGVVGGREGEGGFWRVSIGLLGGGECGCRESREEGERWWSGEARIVGCEPLRRGGSGVEGGASRRMRRGLWMMGGVAGIVGRKGNEGWRLDKGYCSV